MYSFWDEFKDDTVQKYYHLHYMQQAYKHRTYIYIYLHWSKHMIRVSFILINRLYLFIPKVNAVNELNLETAADRVHGKQTLRDRLAQWVNTTMLIVARFSKSPWHIKSENNGCHLAVKFKLLLFTYIIKINLNTVAFWLNILNLPLYFLHKISSLLLIYNMGIFTTIISTIIVMPKVINIKYYCVINLYLYFRGKDI